MRLAPRRKRLQASTSCACPRARWGTSSVPARPSASPSRRNSESNSPFRPFLPHRAVRSGMQYPSAARPASNSSTECGSNEPLPHADATALAAANRRRRAGHFPWWLFLALFLAPDLFLLGYLANARIGAAFYNLAHTLVWPIALLLVSLALPAPELAPYGLIWLSHLGFDRMLGFGLKYPTNFRDTHLERV